MTTRIIAVGLRALMLDDLAPDLPPHERCRRLHGLPEHEHDVLWADLGEAEEERRRAERALGLLDGEHDDDVPDLDHDAAGAAKPEPTDTEGRSA
jgi:hypothetical protein